jgi:hypothetical protein
MPATAHGRQTRHFAPVPKAGTRVAVATLRERISDLHRLASSRAAGDPEQAEALRARAYKLQEAIEILEIG